MVIRCNERSSEWGVARSCSGRGRIPAPNMVFRPMKRDQELNGIFMNLSNLAVRCLPAVVLGLALVSPGSATAALVTTINSSNLDANPAAGLDNFGSITIDGTSTNVTITVALAAGYGFDAFGYAYNGPGTIT